MRTFSKKTSWPDTHYPNRPRHLEDACLYDLVANYDWYIKDEAGNRVYKELKKARLVNHKLFDCNNESQREDFYYSMILLFVPFRDESSFLLANETAEEAYDRLQMSSNTVICKSVVNFLRSFSIKTHAH